jgi:hypothetical protein
MTLMFGAQRRARGNDRGLGARESEVRPIRGPRISLFGVFRNRELERIQRKPVCYNHAAPLELQTAGRHADERSCCLCPNPQGWQIIAGGRNGVETSGCVVLFDARILKGCQSSATPPGAAGDFGLRSGGIALLNPRLLSGKPPACSLGAPKNTAPAPYRRPRFPLGSFVSFVYCFCVRSVGAACPRRHGLVPLRHSLNESKESPFAINMSLLWSFKRQVVMLKNAPCCLCPNPKGVRP